MKKVEEFNSSEERPRCDCDITEKCVICYFRLTEKFPDDFPDEWKFCCGCLEMAKLIIEGNLAHFCWAFNKPNEILQKITLTEGNERR